MGSTLGNTDHSTYNGLESAFFHHSTAGFGSSYWQIGQAKKPVVFTQFLSRNCYVMKKHQQDWGREQFLFKISNLKYYLP